MQNVNEKVSMNKFYILFQIENKIHTVKINRTKKKMVKLKKKKNTKCHSKYHIIFKAQN